MPGRLIDRRLLETLTADFFPQTCTIQQPTKTQSTTGQEKHAWSDVPGLGGVPCRVMATGVGEHRTSNETFAEMTHRILLAGTIIGLTSEMRAVVNNVAYDILLPEIDSEGITTRLSVRLVA